jgi:hypothetical protein
MSSFESIAVGSFGVAVLITLVRVWFRYERMIQQQQEEMT